jgi:hypothetical protein
VKKLKYIFHQLSGGVVSNLAETNPTQPSKPIKIPYNPGSKSYLVAQMLLEGKKDDDTICKEVGVEKKTLWTVKAKLRRLGYIAPRTKTLETPQETQKGTPQGRLYAETPQETPQYAPHEAPPIDKPSNPATPPPSPTPTPMPTPQAQQPPQQLVEEVARRVMELLSKQNPRSSTPSVRLIPLEAEDVEVIGEKVNYKVALNPEIFWRYSVFKAEAERRGRKWDGTFSDFLDLATKDILAVYGIHPTVLSMKGKKLMVELPAEVERETA